MTWTKVFNAVGPAGTSIQTGSGAPSASLGNDGDIYVDLSTSAGGPYLYGAKAGGAWPTTKTTLVGTAGVAGAAGSQFTYGTAVPGAPYTGHAVGDVYLRSTGDLYQLTSNGWVLAFSLLGPVGPQGVSVRSGSGAPASSLGNVNDIYVDTTGSNLYGAKTTSGWPTTFTSLVGLTGASGNVIRTGTGSPSASLGAVGDIYVDLTVGAVTLYGAKTTSGWPSSGTSLVGSQGNIGPQGVPGAAALSILSGSGAPASSLGVQNQPAYVDTTAGALYGAKGASAWPATPLSLVGAAGLSVLSGSGSPASTLGVQNQPAYIDTSAGILYGAKGASAWPTSGISLNGTAIRNGSGSPTSSKPTIQFDGDYYVDTAANVIYGPRASGSWPSSGVAFAGNTIRTGSGAPASSLGATGDVYLDGSSGLLYSKATGSWVATGGNLTGPIGNTGPQGYSSLSNQAASFGGVVQSVSQTLTSTAQTMQNSGSTLPAYVVFPQASAFMGISAANNGVACVVSLVDTTTNTAVYTSSSIAANSNFTTGMLNATTYPLVANRVYQWMITGSGTSNIGINTVFLQPSVLTTAGTGILSGYFSPANITLSSTVQYFYLGGTMSTSNAKTSAYTPLRAGGMLGATALYVPSASGAASATATFTVYTYAQSGGSSGTLATFTATNNGIPQATQLSSVAAMGTGINYYVGVSGTGTGTVDVRFQIVV